MCDGGDSDSGDYDYDYDGGGGWLSPNRVDKNQLKLEELRLQGKKFEQSSEMHALKREMATLKLTTQAMWELLQAKTGYTDEHIKAKIKEIDLRDGKADGKVQVKLQDCQKCNRSVSAKTGRCMYCGTKMERESVF